MNTPAQVAINLLLLARKPDHRRTAAIIGGAKIPDPTGLDLSAR